MSFGRMLVISIFARDTEDTQFSGCDSRIFSKETKFVANFYHEKSIHVRPLDLYHLLLHRRKFTSSLLSSNALLALWGWLRLFDKLLLRIILFLLSGCILE